MQFFQAVRGRDDQQNVSQRQARRRSSVSPVVSTGVPFKPSTAAPHRQTDGASVQCSHGPTRKSHTTRATQSNWGCTYDHSHTDKLTWAVAHYACITPRAEQPCPLPHVWPHVTTNLGRLATVAQRHLAPAPHLANASSQCSSHTEGLGDCLLAPSPQACDTTKRLQHGTVGQNISHHSH